MTLIAVLITVTCGREILYQALENNLNSYLVLVTYWYQALVRDTLGLMWYLLCRLLRSSAQHLAASFQKVGANYLVSCLLVQLYFTANMRLRVIEP
jgi:hypothetical protein